MTQKNNQMAILQQALAQFDIETQVKRISLETLDQYMKGNRQAFEYISQWHDKFSAFESRLSKAEKYYENIEMNVNAKIEVTNDLNVKLQKFSADFWAGIKDSAQSVEQMRKNYINLVRQTGNMAAQLKNCEKNAELISNKLDSTETKLNQEFLKIEQKNNETMSSIVQKNLERIKQSEIIVKKVSEAKSQMNSKSALLTQLLKDISLYKEEKYSLKSQINYLYEQIEKRVLKPEFYEIRTYIDNNFSTHENHLIAEIDKINKQIQEQKNERIKADEFLKKQHQSAKNKTKQSFTQLQKIIETNKAEGKAQMIKIKETMDEQFQRKQQDISICRRKIDQNKQRIEASQQNIQEVDQILKQVKEKVEQFQSNIVSFNNLIGQIQKDSLERDQALKKQKDQRNQEMRKLKMDTSDMGNMGEKIALFGEKISLYEQLISQNEAKITQNAWKISEVSQKSNADVQKLKTNIEQVEQNIQIHQNNLLTKLQKSSIFLTNEINSKYNESLKFTITTIDEKLSPFSKKFQFLENMSSDVQQFKKIFQKQIMESDQINKEIKQKMEKIFAMFTKLKSDFYLKTQALGQQQLKISNKSKDSFKILDEIKKYLSELNQIVLINLSTAFATFFIGLPQNQKNAGFKVASLLQGWVLQIDQKEQKMKYRGETNDPKALLEQALQHIIKIGDKIKGGLIENGKQVYSKIFSSSDEIHRVRKRSISRRRQSQLPKLYK